MKIQWNITKKRGNMRPVLSFTITLSEFERNLAMPAVRIQSAIPKPPDPGWDHCWPGQNERDTWEPEEFYLLMTPSHRSGETSERFKLPWRADNAYPEVEQAFMALRDAFELALEQACNSRSMHRDGSLETSEIAKKTIAPAFAAERMLRTIQG